MTIFINGRLDTQLPNARRAMDYGDGLFETMRFETGDVALWPYHLERLAEGLDRLAINQSIESIESEFKGLLELLRSEGRSAGVIKLRIFRGGGRRGYAPEPEIENYRVFEWAAELPPWGQAERAMLCNQRVAHHPQLAGIKHLNRLEQVLAAREVEQSGHVSAGIMLDYRGMLCCGVDSNLFVEHKGQIFTPKVEESGVNGVFRRYAIQHLTEMNIQVQEEDIDPSILQNCDGLWLSNALRGLRPVLNLSEIADWSNSVSPILENLQSRLHQSLRVTSGVTGA